MGKWGQANFSDPKHKLLLGVQGDGFLEKRPAKHLVAGGI